MNVPVRPQELVSGGQSGGTGADHDDSLPVRICGSRGSFIFFDLKSRFHEKEILETVFELEVVRGAGLEPACLTAKDPDPECVTIFVNSPAEAIWGCFWG